MNEHFFNIVMVAATVAFVVGVVSGVWPVLIISAVISVLLLWLVKRLHI